MTTVVTRLHTSKDILLSIIIHMTKKEENFILKCFHRNHVTIKSSSTLDPSRSGSLVKIKATAYLHPLPLLSFFLPQLEETYSAVEHPERQLVRGAQWGQLSVHFIYQVHQLHLFKLFIDFVQTLSSFLKYPLDTAKRKIPTSRFNISGEVLQISLFI